MGAPTITFFVGFICAVIINRLGMYARPRKGQPSTVERWKLLQQRERALTVREQEWMRWAAYVGGLAHARGIELPPAPGDPGFPKGLGPVSGSPNAGDG